MADLTDTQQLAVDMQIVKSEVHAMNINIAKLVEQISDLLAFKTSYNAKDISGEIDRIKEKHEATERRLSMWLNRGWGAWSAFVLLMGILMGMLQFQFNEMHTKFKELQAVTQQLREKNIEIEQRLKSLGVSAAQKTSTRCAGAGKLPPECEETPPITLPPPSPQPQPTIQEV